MFVAVELFPADANGSSETAASVCVDLVGFLVVARE